MYSDWHRALELGCTAALHDIRELRRCNVATAPSFFELEGAGRLSPLALAINGDAEMLFGGRTHSPLAA